MIKKIIFSFLIFFISLNGIFSDVAQNITCLLLQHYHLNTTLYVELLVTNNANNSVYLLFDYNLIGFEKIDKNTDILLIPYLLNLFTEAYSKGFVPLSFMHWPPTNQEIRPGQNVYVTIQVDDPECKLNDIEDLRFISGLALFTEDPKYININRPSIEIEEYIKAKIVLFDFFPERLTLGEILYRENGKVYGGNVGARRQIFE